MIKYIFSLSLFILSFTLTGCIDTPESAMDQYRFEGMENVAQTYVDYQYSDQMRKVFQDSIIPWMIKEYSFTEIVKAADIVKEYDVYNDIINAKIDKNKILNSFKSLSPSKSAALYASTYNRFKNVNEVFTDSFLTSMVSNAKVVEIVKTYNALKNTPKQRLIKNISCSNQEYTNYFNTLNIKDAAKFYTGTRNIFCNIDTFFNEKITPIIINLPYPAIKDIEPTLRKTPCHSIIIQNMKEAKNECISEIKEEFEFAKSKAIEAVDIAVLPGIDLELDSLSEEHSKKLLKKFSGGFLGFRKITLMFGRDESKFKELWGKYVKGENYDEIFDKHIKIFLSELSKAQVDLYKDITGKTIKRVNYTMISPPLVMDYPNKLVSKVTSYVKDNKFTSLNTLVEWIPIIGDIKEGVDLINNEEESELSDEAIQKLCQGFILSQIDDNYRDSIRNKLILLIINTYDKTYNNIINEL